jgi:hypothetical protein
MQSLLCGKYTDYVVAHKFVSLKIYIDVQKT